eukprot:403356706
MTQLNIQNSVHSQENSSLFRKQSSKKSNSNSRYFCTFEDCSRSFARSARLEQHFRTIHLKEGLHICPFKSCGKSFAEKGNLKVHVRVHTGDKPFQCEVCRKTFRTIGNFKDHERRHSGIKPYSCKVCQQDYYRKYQARRHLQSKHPGLNVKENIIKMTSQQQSEHLRDVKVYQKKKCKELSNINLGSYEESKKLKKQNIWNENSSQESTNASSSFSYPLTPVFSPTKPNVDAQIRNNNQSHLQSFDNQEGQQGEIISYNQILEMSMQQCHNYENPKIISMGLPQQFSGSLTTLQEIFKLDNFNKEQNQKQNNYQNLNQNQKDKQAHYKQQCKFDETIQEDLYFIKQNRQVQNVNKLIQDDRSSQQQMVSRIKKPSSTLLNYFWKNDDKIILQQQKDGSQCFQENLNTQQISLKLRPQNNSMQQTFEAQEDFRNKYLDTIFEDMDMSHKQSGNIDQIQYPAQTESRMIEQNHTDTSPTRFLTDSSNPNQQTSQDFGIPEYQHQNQNSKCFSINFIQESIITNQTRRPCQKKPSIIRGLQKYQIIA